MPTAVSYIPIFTTVLTAVFAPIVFRRWQSRRPAPHLWWWSMGIAVYGVGTFTEGFTTLFGWSDPIFRAWYISGALLGGWPLATGTVYLMFTRRTANMMTAAVAMLVLVASVGVILTPIDLSLVEPYRLTGSVMEWQAVRAFSPFINTYAVIFLIGGAALSAWRYRSDPDTRHRFVGNCFIAVGAILPGIGGAATRMGHTEVLYVMEVIGIVMIWIGYTYNVRPGLRGAPRSSTATSSSPASAT